MTVLVPVMLVSGVMLLVGSAVSLVLGRARPAYRGRHRAIV